MPRLERSALVASRVGSSVRFSIGRTLADDPWQGDCLARTKPRGNGSTICERRIALTLHSLIHAGGVVAFADTEFVLHGPIDWGRAGAKTVCVAEQLPHIACKVMAVIVPALPPSAAD